MTSQPDNEHHVAGGMDIADHHPAGQRDEQDLHPEAELLSQTEAHPDDSVDFDPATGDTRAADASAETAHAGSHPEPVVAVATQVAEEAHLASRSPGTEWHDIQAMFVDDPRRSVQLAAENADAAVSALAELLHRRRSALVTAAAGAPNAPGETEELREMLRSYRIFCQSVCDLGGQLVNAAAPTP